MEVADNTMRRFLAPLAIAGALLLAPAQATYKPEYAAQSFEVQFWYRNAELTQEAQKRFPFKKCCDKSDVVKAKFNVNRVDGRDEWFWLNEGQWQRIPDDVIHWGESAPNGMPTLFIYNGKETCFFPSDGGI